MKSKQNNCQGEVVSLAGQVALATGKVSIRGEHTLRPVIHELLQTAGASVATKMSSQITLVVHGDLSGQVVSDPLREYSTTILGVANEDRANHHVCVVSSRGLSDLLDGIPTPCLQRSLAA